MKKIFATLMVLALVATSSLAFAADTDTARGHTCSSDCSCIVKE